MQRIFAPAKINLFLHVGARRADGFHDLVSLVTFADAGDELHIEKADTLGLKISGPFGSALDAGENNLVLRAVRGMAEIAGRDLPMAITLVKSLPVSSGIGGGSADAAAAMRACLMQWGSTHVSSAALDALALRLGSDVPVCFAGEPALIKGRGETVEPVDLPVLDAVLVNPGVAVSTAEVFAHHSPGSLEIMAANAVPKERGTFVKWLAGLRNDLEKPAIAIAPAIGEALKALSDAGARLARMSGSGATCFGIFPTQDDARDAAARIASTRRGWWVRAVKF